MACEDNFECLEIIVEPSNKGVVLAAEGNFKQLESSKYRSGVASLHALDEVMANYPCEFGFQRFSPFFETFNDKIGQLLAVGLQQVNVYEKELLHESRKDNEIGPQVLTMEHLGLGFLACLIPLGLATAVFLMELVVHKLSMIKN